MLHATIFLRTRQNWSPTHGIPAIPEFSVTFISCLTVMAQFRALAFRDTRPTATAVTTISSKLPTNISKNILARTAHDLSRNSVRIFPFPDIPAHSRASPSSRTAQRDVSMAGPEKRGREAESLFYLMNLAAMTDPIVFFQLRVSGRKSIRIYESLSSERLLLQAIVDSPRDVPIQWSKYQLRLEVRTSKLPWQDLLRCG